MDTEGLTKLFKLLCVVVVLLILIAVAVWVWGALDTLNGLWKWLLAVFR